MRCLSLGCTHLLDLSQPQIANALPCIASSMCWCQLPRHNPTHEPIHPCQPLLYVSMRAPHLCPLLERASLPTPPNFDPAPMVVKVEKCCVCVFVGWICHLSSLLNACPSIMHTWTPIGCCTHALTQTEQRMGTIDDTEHYASIVLARCTHSTTANTCIAMPRHNVGSNRWPCA